ncbi:MAG: hypothetical protein A2Y53_09280 [Chloroflexi bacterium RBG_16_47_49]|nr:MAG: hypothetical protein A2Y53_09280 [Chloroflexi bacterium RBG_16_47_49]
MAKSLEYDLRYIKAGLEILEEYLLSDDVFWPLGVKPPEGDPDYPRLTLDWLLLIRTRLAAHPTSGDQKNQVEQVISELELNRSKWRVAWERKAAHCYQVRERMWRDYIQEYQDNPQENADRYRYEVRLRVMLELLKSEFRPQNIGEGDLLLSLDSYLKSTLIPGSFIWDPEIQAGFPRNTYWFLYGKLASRFKK